MKDHDQQPLSEAKAVCHSHVCPECGSHDVVVERQIVGGTSTTLCHCRVCDHSWAPHLVAS